MAIISTLSSLAKQAQSAPGTLTNPSSVIPANITKQDTATPAPNLISGSTALANKTSSPYSNNQFIAPFNYSINVEGKMMSVDYLGKKIKTNNSQPYRAIVSLSAAALPEPLVEDPFESASTNRAAKQTPSAKAALQQYNTGTKAVTNNISGRLTQVTSAVAPSITSATGILNGINQPTGGAPGAITNTAPSTTASQAVANLPGFNFNKDSFGNLQGGIAGLSQALSNPTSLLGNAGSLAQTAAKDLGFTTGLPSVSLGSLTSLFSIASDLAHSGPPTSLTGLVAIEKQVKALICNFKLPSITIPPGFPGSITDTFKDFNIGSAVSTAFNNAKTQIADVGKHLKKEFEDTLSNIKNQINIVKDLKLTLPDFNSIYKSAVKELTTCDNSPNTKNNVKSGQPSSSPQSGFNTSGAGPTSPDSGLSTASPIANTGTGFGAAFTSTGDPQTFGSAFTSTGAPQTFGSAFTSTGDQQTFGSAGPGAATPAAAPPPSPVETGGFVSTGQGAFTSTSNGSFTPSNAGAFVPSSGGAFGSSGAGAFNSTKPL